MCDQPSNIEVAADWTEAEYERFLVVVRRICESNYWHWNDMLEMEQCIPGMTARMAEAYGVSVEVYEEILTNGKGFYVTPDIKREFFAGFYQQ